MKHIIILGSTGSIGVSALEVLAGHSDRFQVRALTAATKDGLIAEQIALFHPDVVAMADDHAASRLRSRPNLGDVTIYSGAEGLIQAATLDQADLVISAIVGAAGLVPTLAAIRAGKDVALANKEPMVMAGQLMQQEAHAHDVTIFPVDSEHSALFQSMQGHRKEDIRRLILTCSGGPFRTCTREDMRHKTKAEALNHPNWEMGSKITIDSATLMNKGLEVIEAHWLFDIPASKIEVIIHPQSIIHSMVEYNDGSIIAQMGNPDMKIPIAYALSYPEHIPLDFPRCDLVKESPLSFEAPDTERFPCLALAYRALQTGGTMPAVLNAANEVAVQGFLDDKITFLDIERVIQGTMDGHSNASLDTLDDALRADRWAREYAKGMVNNGIADEVAMRRVGHA